MKIEILSSAVSDLIEGRQFYEEQGEGLGEYFFDSLFSDIDSLALYSTASALYKIVIPRVTRKERHLLDAAMPCLPGWRPQEIELPEEFIETYRQIYRFLPAYAELLL